MNTFVNIDKPCNENWNEMSQKTNGRYCDSCNKVVVDFTKMKNEEIVSYISKTGSSELCGNFHSAQTSKTNFLQRYYFYIDRSTLFLRSKKITLFLLGILIFISGCRTHVRGKIRVAGDQGFQNKNSSSISK